MAIQTLSSQTTVPPQRERIPILENGDHLTREEFHRRYEAMPKNVRAELIEGVVFMSSPARYAVHSSPQALAITWIGTYSAATPGTKLGDNATLFVDADNELQPDAFLRIEESYGGDSRVGADDYIYGAPELVIEIAASTVSRDLHDKLRVYRRGGVQEYLVWRTEDEAVDWFRLRRGEYEKLEPDANGVIRSEMFPGLWLAVDKPLSGDLASVLAELQRGLAMPEHAAFVGKLQATQSTQK